MNKYLLNICLLASVANVSAASLADGCGSLLNPTDMQGSTVKETGAENGLPGAASTVDTRKFPSALEVTYGDRNFIIPVNPTMLVFALKDLLAKNLLISGGHKYMCEGAEIMDTNVNPKTKALITLAQVFSKNSGIVKITIEQDPSKSPLPSTTATPAPQSAATSPATGGESPATKPVDGEGAVSDASLGEETPPKPTSPKAAE
jgi:hypothetical protein